MSKILCKVCNNEIDKSAIMLPPAIEISILAERDALPKKFIYRILCSFCNSEVMIYSVDISRFISPVASAGIKSDIISKKAGVK